MSLTTNENTDGTLSRDRSDSPMVDEGSFEGSNNETVVLKKGPWTSGEDEILIGYVKKHGEGNWNAVQKNTGLLRCGKSCRLRWANHLRPNLKKGAFTEEEEKKIIEFHAKMGNKWAKMASLMDGRTDNEIKNYWNTRTKRLQRAGLPLYPPELCMQIYKENQQNIVVNGIHNEDEGHYDLMQSNHEIPDVRFDSLNPNHEFFPYVPDIPSPVFNLVPSTTVHRQKRLRESADLFSGYSGDFVSGPVLPFEDDIRENINPRPFNSLPFGVNGDFSASRHNLVPVKKELPSFQTEIGSWGSSSLEPHFPEPVDVFIQSPEPSGPAQAQAQEDSVSPRNSGLLDALVYEAKALNRGKNKLSDKSSSSSRVSPGDISNSSSVDVCMTEGKDYGEPLSPFGNSITSYFSECTPMSATGSSLVESPLGETFPGYNQMLEQVGWSWTQEDETKETRNQIDFSRPDAVLGACWFKQSVSRGKDQGSTSGAVSDFFGDDLGCDFKSPDWGFGSCSRNISQFR